MPVQEGRAKVVKLGVMLDDAFTFYYPENLEALAGAGAELVFIDSLHEQKLPDIDGLYIGGGFPEMFLPELEANIQLRRDIACAIENYLPVYAECAGLMYLCRAIRWRGERHEMAGVIPCEVELCQRPQGHGYTEIETGENPFFPAGAAFWGHEFHYSRVTESDNLKFGYLIRRGQGVDGQRDGVIYKNMLATFTHLHALGVPQWAESFVSLALRSRIEKEELHA
jgi:cobyrinic acid a,c-diamide synthase